MNVLDLFSGIGGFSLGLERAGMRTVAFCEIEPFCRAVLKKHWPEVPCYEDVTELSSASLAADGIKIDAICGGFPCQDVSVAGIWNTAGVGLDGKRSGLWKEYSRLVGELRPQFVIVENVAGLLGNGLGRVLGDLAALGYDAEWHCIPACNVGAPHIRDRVWVVAYPQQKQRVRAIFNADDVASAIWVGAAEWDENGVRSEVGGARRSVPGRWLDEPDPPGVADGFPDWPHRLGACGNAVVPQIPEIIGRAIMMQAERSLTTPQANEQQ
jgi:DNA (cytosine-5)-methyltransferase 1